MICIQSDISQGVYIFDHSTLETEQLIKILTSSNLPQHDEYMV